MMRLKFFVVALLLALVTSCTQNSVTNNTADFEQSNTTEILKFIADNNLEAQNTSSGLYYIIEEEGIGSNPLPGATVRVAYKGYFTNGKVFDESNDEGIVFPLDRVIKGWTEGIPLFKEGGKGKLIIPSKLAYDNSGTRGIPPGAVLVFDVNLLEIQDQ